MRTLFGQVGTISFLGYTVTSWILMLLASGIADLRGVRGGSNAAASNVFLRT